MKLDEILIEGQPNVAPYVFVTSQDNFFKARFNVEPESGDTLLFSVVGQLVKNNYGIYEGIPERWDIAFSQLDHNNNETHEMTGTGNQFTVLSTVQAILNEWFGSHQTNCVTMSAAIPSRIRVYTRLLQRAVPGCQVRVEGKFIIATRTQQQAA